MSDPAEIRIEPLRRRRRRADEVWQGAIVRMPTWITGETERGPYRPEGPVWTSRATGLVHIGKIKPPGESTGDDALDALFDFVQRQRFDWAPARIEVPDARIAEHLRSRLGPEGPEVRVAERLDAVAAVMAAMAEHAAGPFAARSSLDEPGVDVARLRSFAEAAAAFHRAALWNHLANSDLIHIADVDPDLSWVTVLGQGGQEYGLGFYPTRKAFETVLRSRDTASAADQASWALTFGRIFEMTLPDCDTWVEHGLPVAADHAYPLLARYDLERGEFRLADAVQLGFVEALLRALTSTTEDELDSGRWKKTVPTPDGARAVELSLPDLLAGTAPRREDGAPPPFDRRMMERTMRAMQRLVQERAFESEEDLNAFVNSALAAGEVPPPTSALDRARDLAASALDFTGRQRIRLAREAIRIDRDCAEAWLLLAEEMPDLERSAELYVEAASAGARALGLDLAKGVGGRRREPLPDADVLSWGNLDARPYLRARLGFALRLDELGRRDEAIELWQELVRIEPGDHQGVRWILAPALLEAGRLDEADELFARYEEDTLCGMPWGRALAAFARHGDGEAARGALEFALAHNLRVPKYLTGKAPLPDELPPHFSPGSEEEAQIAAQDLLKAWSGVPGALPWLATFVRDRKRSRKPRRAVDQGRAGRQKRKRH